MSYTSLAKRAEYLRFAPEGSLQAVKWAKLTEKLYGEPLYKFLIRSRGRRRR